MQKGQRKNCLIHYEKKQQHKHHKTISFDIDRLLNAVSHIICT